MISRVSQRVSRFTYRWLAVWPLALGLCSKALTATPRAPFNTSKEPLAVGTFYRVTLMAFDSSVYLNGYHFLPLFPDEIPDLFPVVSRVVDRECQLWRCNVIGYQRNRADPEYALDRPLLEGCVSYAVIFDLFFML